MLACQYHLNMLMLTFNSNCDCASVTLFALLAHRKRFPGSKQPTLFFVHHPKTQFQKCQLGLAYVNPGHSAKATSTVLLHSEMQVRNHHHQHMRTIADPPFFNRELNQKISLCCYNLWKRTVQSKTCTATPIRNFMEVNSFPTCSAEVTYHTFPSWRGR